LQLLSVGKHLRIETAVFCSMSRLNLSLNKIALSVIIPMLCLTLSKVHHVFDIHDISDPGSAPVFKVTGCHTDFVLFYLRLLPTFGMHPGIFWI